MKPKKLKARAVFDPIKLPRGTRLIRTVANSKVDRPIFVGYVPGIPGMFWHKTLDGLVQLIGDKLNERPKDAQ